MNLDVTSLLVINVVNLTVMATTLPLIMGRELSVAARSARNSLIVQAVGWILMIAAGQWIGHWMDRALSSVAVACAGVGQWWMYAALRGWLGPRPGERLLQVLVVLTPLGYFLSFGSYPVRVGWSNLLLATQLGIVGWACLYPRMAVSGRWRWALLGCLWTMAGFTAARGVLGAFFTELYPYFRAPHPVNVAAMVATNVTLVLGNVAVLVAWRTEAEAQLQEQAHTDPLSGLLNRRGWAAHTTILWSHFERAPDNLALMIIDIDHFKRINDSLGHEAGDVVIRGLGEILRTTVRGGDVVARLGGEEFAVLMPLADESAARSLEARLRAAVQSLEVPGLRTPVNFSSGLALANAHDLNVESLLARADSALYLAKTHGRGHMEVAPFISNLSHDYGSSAL